METIVAVGHDINELKPVFDLEARSSLKRKRNQKYIDFNYLNKSIYFYSISPNIPFHPTLLYQKYVIQIKFIISISHIINKLEAQI